MSSVTPSTSFGSLVPPTDRSKSPSGSLLQHSLTPPTHALESLSLNPSNDGRLPSPAAASSLPIPNSPAFNSRTTSATATSSAGGQPRPLGLRKRISGSFEIRKTLKEHIPDIAIFFAMMTGLPLIREAVEGVQTVQVGGVASYYRWEGLIELAVVGYDYQSTKALGIWTETGETAHYH